MAYKISKNPKQSGRNDKLIEKVEGVYDSIDEVMNVLGNLSRGRSPGRVDVAL